MESYVRVPIFPTIRYMNAKERGNAPSPMMPVSFRFGEREVTVDAVLTCERGVSRKAGGRGFRYACRVSFGSNEQLRTQTSTVWYDDFLCEWFVEVPRSRMPADWTAATQLGELDEFYGGE